MNNAVEIDYKNK